MKRIIIATVIRNIINGIMRRLWRLVGVGLLLVAGQLVAGVVVEVSNHAGEDIILGSTGAVVNLTFVPGQCAKVEMAAGQWTVSGSNSFAGVSIPDDWTIEPRLTVARDGASVVAWVTEEKSRAFYLSSGLSLGVTILGFGLLLSIARRAVQPVGEL